MTQAMLIVLATALITITSFALWIVIWGLDTMLSNGWPQ